MICLLCENLTAIIKSETSTFKGITYEHEYINCSSCGEDYETEELIDKNLNKIRSGLNESR